MIDRAPKQIASIEAHPGLGVSSEYVAHVLIPTLWLEGMWAEKVLASPDEAWWCKLHLGEVFWARLKPVGVHFNRLAMRVVAITPASDEAGVPVGRFIVGPAAGPSEKARVVVDAAVGAVKL